MSTQISKAAGSFHLQQTFSKLALGGERVDFFLTDSRVSEITVNAGNGPRKIRSYDIPTELKSGDCHELLIKTANFSVSYLSNGDNKIKLTLPVLGGMMRRETVIKSLASREGYSQVLNALDRQLLKVPFERHDDLQSYGIVTGGVIGCGVGGAAVGALAGTLVAPIIGTFVGAIIGFLTGSLAGGGATSNYLQKQNVRAIELKEDVEKVFNAYCNASELSESGDEQGAHNVANEMLGYLLRKGYLSEYSEHVLAFHQEKFNEIKKFLTVENHQSVLISFKLMICLLAIVLKNCPNGSVITELEKILKEGLVGVHDGIKNPILFLLGRCYLVSSGDLSNRDSERSSKTAKSYFEKIPRSSDLFQAANYWIKQIDIKLEERGGKIWLLE